MPFYVFKCQKCDHEVTELRVMEDYTPPRSCEDCPGEGPCEFKKVLAPANFKIDPAAG